MCWPLVIKKPGDLGYVCCVFALHCLHRFGKQDRSLNELHLNETWYMKNQWETRNELLHINLHIFGSSTTRELRYSEDLSSLVRLSPNYCYVHLKFNPTGARAHDLQTMHCTFYVPKVLVLVNHCAILGRHQGPLKKRNVLPHYLGGMGRKCTGSQIDLCICMQLVFFVQVWLGQKDYAPQVRPDQGLNPWPPDHGKYILCPWDSYFNHWSLRGPSVPCK